MDSNQALETLLRGDPIEAMEAAKQIIGDKHPVDPAALEAIALDKKARKWSRIAAIYSLGFIGDRAAIPTLSRILSDRHSAIPVRAHAAEALGNIADADAVAMLSQVLLRETSPSVRHSVTYALEEIGGPEAHAALNASSSLLAGEG